MGLFFALFVDPTAGPNMPIIARFFNLLLLLLFLSFDIHLWMLSLLADSFQLIPIQSLQLTSKSFILVAQSAGIIFYYGLLLVLPILTLLLILVWGS